METRTLQMKKAILAAALAAVMLPATTAYADPPAWAPANGYRDHKERADHYDRHDRNDRGHNQYQAYQPRRGYDRRLSRNDRVWRGNDGRTYCHRTDGSTGLAIGAGTGALAGSAIASNSDQTLGIILGALGGGVAGRSIDRGNIRCR
jgi:hypothetical protein